MFREIYNCLAGAARATSSRGPGLGADFPSLMERGGWAPRRIRGFGDQQGAADRERDADCRDSAVHRPATTCTEGQEGPDCRGVPSAGCLLGNGCAPQPGSSGKPASLGLSCRRRHWRFQAEARGRRCTAAPRSRERDEMGTLHGEGLGDGVLAILARKSHQRSSPRRRCGGPPGPKERIRAAEGVADTSADALSKRLEGVLPVTAHGSAFAAESW